MAEIQGVKEVEAILFASGKAMEEAHIKELTELKPKATRTALETLQTQYKEHNSALFIWNEGTKWKINVKEDYVPLVKSLVAETEMPRATLETLAVIAYRSPILQSDVIKARGEGAYEHVAELVERGFITKERFGRSYKIRIADKFYHYFDVQGDQDIREAFAQAKQPDIEKYAKKAEQNKLGELTVVAAESDEDHEQHRKETQLEIYNIEQQREDDKKNYLNDFESRLGEVSGRINEAEQHILEQKKTVEAEQQEKDEIEDEISKELGDIPQEEGEESPQEVIKKVNEQIEELTKDKE